MLIFRLSHTVRAWLYSELVSASFSPALSQRCSKSSGRTQSDHATAHVQTCMRTNRAGRRQSYCGTRCARHYSQQMSSACRNTSLIIIPRVHAARAVCLSQLPDCVLAVAGKPSLAPVSIGSHLWRLTDVVVMSCPIGRSFTLFCMAMRIVNGECL